MITIWKFPLVPDDEIIIEMPKDAEILSVQVQKNIPCIWALVNSDAVLEKRTFSIFGTGHPVKFGYKRKFIGTFQLYEGDLVWHLFETD